jgi:esterase
MELNYKSYGTGEPLLVLHGLWGMLDNWVSFAKSISSEYEVFLIDLRNHGKSAHSPEHNYYVMARDIYEFLEEQNIFSVNILGHSMGGKVALQFAVFFPGYVRKLVVADIFPKKYDADVSYEHFKILEAIEFINHHKFSNRTDAEIAVTQIIADQKIAMLLFKNLTYIEPELIGWKFNSNALPNNFALLSENIEISHPIKAPVLFLKGEKSNYITTEDIQNLPHFFPNGIIEIIPKAGHWLHTDQPTIFRERVIEFLKKS